MKAVVLTVSDGCYHGQRPDLSGQALTTQLREAGWDVAGNRIVPDEMADIREQVLACCDSSDTNLMVMTGGTGLGPRDVTPEAVRPLLSKEAPGLAELMRLEGLKKTPFAALSRSLAESPRPDADPSASPAVPRGPPNRWTPSSSCFPTPWTSSKAGPATDCLERRVSRADWDRRPSGADPAPAAYRHTRDRATDGL